MRPIVSDRVAWSVVCHTSEPCKIGCTDRDAVWAENSGGPREPCIRCGSRSPMERVSFEWERGVSLEIIGTLCGYLCKNGWTDRDAFSVMGSDRPKESCVRWESRGAEGRCHSNQFWDAICYNWLFGFLWAISFIHSRCCFRICM